LERRSTLLNRVAGLLPAALLFGCHPAPVAPKATGAVVPPPLSTESKRWASTAAVRTEPGPVAVASLTGELQGFSRLLSSPHQRAYALKGLVDVLGARAQFLGLVEDYDLALADAEALVPLQPQDPKAYLARAHARSSLHLFSQALADLDEADKLDSRLESEIEGQRAGIRQAMGRTAEALETLRSHAEDRPSIITLGALGVCLADLGKTEEADALFAKAPLDYYDGSPFPVAWISFQRGQMWERQGQPAKAIGYYREATERLPEYAVAEAHLAGLMAAEGQRDQAIAILREVTKTATDPEFLGQLGALLEESGQKDEAAKDKMAAAAGFENLLAKHPEAFADHAARFYLGPGANPKRALELATLNLKGRQSPDAFDLALTAALEAGDAATACQIGKQASTAMKSLPTPHLEFLAKKAAEGCQK
jgi:tetratricopeptide (TPR) repeat protein